MTERLNNQYSDEHHLYETDLDEKILSRISDYRVPDGKSREEALADLKKLVSERNMWITGKKENRSNVRVIRWTLSAAAGILILLGLWQIFSSATETRINATRGSHTEYTLSDGTEIRLNADSWISYKKRNFVSDRKVTMKGEAFFNVSKGESFMVYTPNGSIMILGTSFNIFSRDNIFKVTCFDGKVLVASGNQSVTIGPEESVRLSGKDLIRYREGKIQYVTGWIKGEFYYENTPLNLVFNEIERQFNVKFVGRERNDEFFTGSFINKDLKTALEIVCFPMGLKYEVDENGKISVRSKKD